MSRFSSYTMAQRHSHKTHPFAKNLLSFEIIFCFILFHYCLCFSEEKMPMFGHVLLQIGLVAFHYKVVLQYFESEAAFLNWQSH